MSMDQLDGFYVYVRGAKRNPFACNTQNNSAFCVAGYYMSDFEVRAFWRSWVCTSNGMEMRGRYHVEFFYGHKEAYAFAIEKGIESNMRIHDLVDLYLNFPDLMSEGYRFIAMEEIKRREKKEKRKSGVSPKSPPVFKPILVWTPYSRVGKVSARGIINRRFFGRHPSPCGLIYNH